MAALVLVACDRHRAPAQRPFHRLPTLGTHVLVLAPHPDDEVLGAAGAMEATLRSGGDVRVAVATDDEMDPAGHRHGDELAIRRREESRQALGRLSIGGDHVAFFGYAGGSLAAAWTERWTAVLRGHGGIAAGSIVEDLRRTIREGRPDTILFPLPLDEQPDHRALARFALLAVLAEDGGGALPEMLGYLIHGHRHWAGRPPDPSWREPPPDGCPGALYRWSRMVLDPTGVFRKAGLIGEYHSQLADNRRLLRYAGRYEPFARGLVVLAPRAASPTRPGVRLTPRGILLRIPVASCVVNEGDRLRLRFFRGGHVEERVIADRRGRLEVEGGLPGTRLGRATDVRPSTTQGAIRLALAGAAFADVPGALVEVIPRDPRRAGPIWLVRWARP